MESLAVLLPTIVTIIGAALTLSWKLGKAMNTIENLCKDTDDIRDEIRDLRAERRLSPGQAELPRDSDRVPAA